MRKWGMALAAAGLLAGGAAAGDLKYVPVDTSRNLAAPVNVYAPMVHKKSWFGRVGDSIRSLSPFSSKKTVNTPPGPIVQGAQGAATAGANLVGKAAALTGPAHGFSGSAR